jgi:DNA polymerase III subunit delta
MTYEQIIKDLQNKIYKPIYFLMGNEPYYIDKITDYIAENVLTEAEKAFNQTILYGKDVDLGTVINTARRFPMMANYHVVIIKEAQNIKGINGETGKGKNPKPNPLQLFLENPPKSSILVINFKYDSIDRRTKFPKTIEKNGVLFESKKLYENQLPQWITQYAAGKKLRTEPQASVLMAEFLGSDLNKITNEIDKLELVIPANSSISVNIVEKYIGISHEYNIFELNKAIGARDILKANRIVQYLGKNAKDSPALVIIGSLYEYFIRILKLHTTSVKGKEDLSSLLGISSFFLEEYQRASKIYSVSKTISNISILRTFDLKSKGVDAGNSDSVEILKELVYRLMH